MPTGALPELTEAPRDLVSLSHLTLRTLQAALPRAHLPPQKPAAHLSSISPPRRAGSVTSDELAPPHTPETELLG